jgi:hypothetical protein
MTSKLQQIHVSPLYGHESKVKTPDYTPCHSTAQLVEDACERRQAIANQGW